MQNNCLRIIAMVTKVLSHPHAIRSASRECKIISNNSEGDSCSIKSSSKETRAVKCGHCESLLNSRWLSLSFFY